jgi:hypothetical protein
VTGVLAAAAYGEARFASDVTAEVHRVDGVRLVAALPDFDVEETDETLVVTSAQSPVRFRLRLTDDQPTSVRGELFGVSCAVPREDDLFADLAASASVTRGLQRGLALVALAVLAETKPDLERLLPADARW